MTYEVHIPAANKVIGAYATEAEAHNRANAFNALAARTSGMRRHWSQKAVVRLVSLASMQTVGAA